MHESTLHFGATGEVPVEKEKPMVQERERVVAQCCVSEDERKCNLAYVWGGKPRSGGGHVILGHGREGAECASWGRWVGEACAA